MEQLSENHSKGDVSPMSEELDFEDELSNVDKNEDINKMDIDKNDSPNKAHAVNVKIEPTDPDDIIASNNSNETSSDVKDSSEGSENIVNSKTQEDESESDSGEIVDDDDDTGLKSCDKSTKNKSTNGNNSESDTGEIDGDEEPNELEEGEIKDASPVTKKNFDTTCRFFQRGSCMFGSLCQYRHVSDSVYKMLDKAPMNQRMARNFHGFHRPPFYPPPFFPGRPVPDMARKVMEINSMPQKVYNVRCEETEGPHHEVSWEKGLEQAKALINRANMRKKGLDDKNEKDDECRDDGYSPKPMGEDDRKYNEPYKNDWRNNQPYRKQNSYRHNRQENREQPKDQFKWVDPWRRSKSPKGRKRMRSISPVSPPYSRSCSSCSYSSSLSSEDIYGTSFKRKKSKSPSQQKSPPPSSERLRHRRKHARTASRSQSKSPRKRAAFSSSPSRSPSSLSSRGAGKKPLFSNRIIRMRRSRSPPKDYATQPPGPPVDGKEASPKRADDEEYHSDSETYSEVTVSSMSCTSHTRSSDSAVSHRSEERAGRLRPSPPPRADVSKPYQRSFPKREYARQEEPPKSSASRHSVPSGKRDMMKRFISDTKKASDSSNRPNRAEEFVPRETSRRDRGPNNRDEGQRKRDDHPEPKSTKKDVPKPANNMKSEKRSKAVDSMTNELMRYQKFSNNYSDEEEEETTRQNSKTNKSKAVDDTKTSKSKAVDDAKANKPKAVDDTNASATPASASSGQHQGAVSKPKITMTLKPKKSLARIKTEVTSDAEERPPATVEPTTGGKEKEGSSSKRDMLLLQLKLIEDAIARKKSS